MPYWKLWSVLSVDHFLWASVANLSVTLMYFWSLELFLFIGGGNGYKSKWIHNISEWEFLQNQGNCLGKSLETARASFHKLSVVFFPDVSISGWIIIMKRYTKL